MDLKTVRFELDAGLAFVRMNRPKARNALSRDYGNDSARWVLSEMRYSAYRNARVTQCLSLLEWSYQNPAFRLTLAAAFPIPFCPPSPHEKIRIFGRSSRLDGAEAEVLRRL